MVLLYPNADLTLFAQKEWKLLELNSALCVGFVPGVVLGTIPQTLSCSSPEEGSWRLVTVCPLHSHPLGEKNGQKICISCLVSLA